MKDRIENLETLNERLADERFDMNYNWAETAYEKLAWHFFRTKPFDTDILYKGTCARFDEGIERPLTDEGVEEMKARYTHLFTADNQQLRQWLFSTPLENVAAYTTKIVRQTVIDAVVGLYDPAQDFYADNWYEWNDYEQKKITGRQFVENIYAKMGTTNWIRPADMIRAMEMMTVGYVMALFTFLRRRDELVRIAARRLSMPANSPDCSPATTMFTYMSSNIFGNADRDLDMGSPPSMVARMCVSTFLNSGLSHCSSSVCIVARIGMPAPIIDASWRVKGMTSFATSFFSPFIFGISAITPPP